MPYIPEALEGRVDLDLMWEAAAEAASQLHVLGHTVVGLTPGDMTVYTIVIVDTAATIGQRVGSPFVVALARLGLGYPWDGHGLSEDYVQTKWTTNTRSSDPHTARVLCAFLNMVAAELRNEGTPDR